MKSKRMYIFFFINEDYFTFSEIPAGHALFEAADCRQVHHRPWFLLCLEQTRESLSPRLCQRGPRK